MTEFEGRIVYDTLKYLESYFTKKIFEIENDKEKNCTEDYMIELNKNLAAIRQLMGSSDIR